MAGVNGVTIRVPATGGTPEPVTQLAEGEQSNVVNDILPGGEVALVRVTLAGGVNEIRALTLETGESVTLTPGVIPQYSASGHLAFLTADGTLMAALFDPNGMELTGPSVPLVDDVIHYALSETGTYVLVQNFFEELKRLAPN